MGLSLGALGLGAAGMALAACTTDASPATSSDGAAGAPPAGSPPGSGDSSIAAGEIPEETAGPYPADGSNGVDVLSQSGIVRRDIRGSFGGASAVAVGVPLQIDLRVIDLQGSDSEPMVGAAVYLWHCDSTGRYSMYSSGIEGENYLRGVQVAGAGGRVRFTSIYPGCYDGRWPHVRFEVYPTAADAQSAANRLRTSQLALPQDTSEAVYADDRYADSAANLARTSLSRDMVFSDGYSLQLATVTGDLETGFTATLKVPV